MLWQLLAVILAGIGVVSVAWGLFGWLLSGCAKGWILCPGRQDALAVAYVCLWLRSAGIVRCPVVVVDYGLDTAARSSLARQGAEVCRLAELADWIGMGEIEA